jgi:hypothetical protein
MFCAFRYRMRLPLAVLALAGLLGGCVYSPYPAYGGGYGAPYYAGPTVAFGGGWGWHDRDGGWRGHGWHDGDWRR